MKGNNTVDWIRISREAVDLLERFAPETLAEFRTEMPELARELRRGGLAGAGDPHLADRVKITHAALELAVDQCRRGCGGLARRIRLVGVLRLTTSVITVIGGSAVIGTAAQKSPVVTVVAGTVALFGAICNVIADQLMKYPIGGEEPLFGVREDLSRQLTKGESLLRQIRPYVNKTVSLPDEQKSVEEILLRAAEFLETVNVHRYLIEKVLRPQ